MTGSENLELFIGDFNNDLWRVHLEVPEVVARRFMDGNNRRVICTMPDGEKYQLALMPTGGNWCLLMNKNLVSRYRLEEGGKISVVLERDNSEYGMEFLEELVASLDLDSEAKSAFEKLTKGKQRSLMYIVNKVKSKDSRLRKAMAITQHLAEAGTDLDYKRLNQLIKEYNNKLM